jgi:hypothetical protein
LKNDQKEPFSGGIVSKKFSWEEFVARRKYFTQENFLRRNWGNQAWGNFHEGEGWATWHFLQNDQKLNEKIIK